ncbi:polyphenol oxidase family protein, partial [Phocaeicola vulgatus]|nr:polyphenol oxidase family protein [Phocaeicola vulgatus]
CLPVLLADPVTGVIGAAHCGRRGLERGIIESTVELMKLKGADPTNIIATLGPHICGDCYEVGDEVADQFVKRFPLTKTQ